MCCSTLKTGKILFILGIYLLQLGKKTYFLSLGTIPVIGVSFIGRKITECDYFSLLLQYLEAILRKFKTGSLNYTQWETNSIGF